MKRDYKLDGFPGETRGGAVLRRHHLLWLAASLGVVALVISLLPDAADASRHEVEQLGDKPVITAAAVDTASGHVEETLTLPMVSGDEPALPEAQSSETAAATTSDEATTWREVTIKPGDSLAAVFSREGLSATTLHNILHSGQQARQLRDIRPGELIRLHTSGDRLEELLHVQSPTRQLRITRAGEGFHIQAVERDYEHRLAYSQGQIQESLFLAGQDAGLSEAVIMDLAAIFGWDIDFALDIRRGDEFRVVYEELWLDGEKQADGNILAAEFINQGRSVRAVRYTSPDKVTSYYAPDGNNMRKAFLRTPVDFRRISSRFGNRKHPILNSMRLHTGVDYAAARGTPVRATGDGRITYRGWKGGYGKAVIIQHGSAYSTLYGHLNGFDRKAPNGSRVRQGQVIGYVGSTGRATGPHLHYEFRVNGAHRNPLTVKLPSAEPIDSRYKNDFLNQTRGLLAQLEGLRRTQVALSDN